MQPTEAERRLIDAAREGEVADFSSPNHVDNDPEKAMDWDESRTIRAEVIWALSTQSNPQWSVHTSGIRLEAARIRGSLNLLGAQIVRPIILLRCSFDEGIVLTDAKSRSIVLTGSRLPFIDAEYLSVNGSIVMDGRFHALGEVRLNGVKISGRLFCRDGRFDKGLLAAFAKVNEIVLDAGFCAKGPVNLLGTQIEGFLYCPGGLCEMDLQAVSLRAGAVMLTNGFRALGNVRLTGAKIDGLVFCSGTFEKGLNCDVMEARSVFLSKGFKAGGDVTFLNAKLDGGLVCGGGSFEKGLKADAIEADSVLLDHGTRVHGSVSLQFAKIRTLLNCGGGRFDGDFNVANAEIGTVSLNEGFSCGGDVNLTSATIHSFLRCNGGSFAKALYLEGITTGPVFLNDGFNIAGDVRLNDAKIEGQLVCAGGNVGGSLVADSLTAGHVNLADGFCAKGDVRLVGARISGTLNCNSGTFEGRFLAVLLTSRRVVFGNESVVRGQLSLAGSTTHNLLSFRGGSFENGIDLTHARTGLFADDRKSWPEAGTLLLEGFGYVISSGDGVPRDAKSRLDWIELGPKVPFLSQPYEELVRVLRAIGDEAGARRVSIRKHSQLRKRGKIGLAAWFWNWVLFLTVGYGYLGWLPFVWTFVVVIGGAFVFGQAEFRKAPDANPPAAVADAARSGPQMTVGQGEYAPLPHPVIYSIDVFLPFADLHQKEAWLLDEKSPRFLGYQAWYLFEELAGWVLTALLAAAATGLLKS